MAIRAAHTQSVTFYPDSPKSMSFSMKNTFMSSQQTPSHSSFQHQLFGLKCHLNATCQAWATQVSCPENSSPAASLGGR